MEKYNLYPDELDKANQDWLKGQLEISVAKLNEIAEVDGDKKSLTTMAQRELRCQESYGVCGEDSLHFIFRDLYMSGNLRILQTIDLLARNNIFSYEQLLKSNLKELEKNITAFGSVRYEVANAMKDVIAHRKAIIG